MIQFQQFYWFFVYEFQIISELVEFVNKRESWFRKWNSDWKWLFFMNIVENIPKIQQYFFQFCVIFLHCIGIWYYFTVVRTCKIYSIWSGLDAFYYFSFCYKILIFFLLFNLIFSLLLLYPIKIGQNIVLYSTIATMLNTILDTYFFSKIMERFEWIISMFLSVLCSSDKRHRPIARQNISGSSDTCEKDRVFTIVCFIED